MAKLPLVSVLIVNWNGLHLLDECLESVFRQTYDRIEVVVVDNGSVDGSAAHISYRYPTVKLVSLSENKGFAGGNNCGLACCTGEFLALVNNDVVLADAWVEEMIKPMLAATEVGLCSSRIFVKGTRLLDSIGDRFTSAFTGTKLGEGENGGLYDGDVFVHGVCAAAALYRHEMIKQIGFFDEDLFLNYEDTDLNLRAWLRGWKCVYVPDACCEHAVNTTIGKMSPTSVFYFSRNSILVLVKNIPLRLIVRRLPQRLLYELLVFFYYAVLHKRFISYLRGKVDAIRMLPVTLQKRRELIPKIKLSDQDILSRQYPISRAVFDRWTSR